MLNKLIGGQSYVTNYFKKKFQTNNLVELI
jgi:hypothetical protein